MMKDEGGGMTDQGGTVSVEEAWRKEYEAAGFIPHPSAFILPLVLSERSIVLAKRGSNW
jgi:hypothetical protein